MQAPHFLALGFDLGRFHSGTINVSIKPCAYRVVKASHTFSQVKWHPTEPAEDFSFFDVRVTRADGSELAGAIYYPHPDTKPEHFQQPDILELLLPFVEGIQLGEELSLAIPENQMAIDRPPGVVAGAREVAGKEVIDL